MVVKSVVSDRLEQIDADYQLVIIGGGVYGAALCWEASHRGIKTLLLEQEDYACGASSNSLKTIHGGLRSLQSLNLKAVIKGIRERSIFLRIAPNYVKKLPCLLPTTAAFMKSRLIVGMGLLLYNLLSLLRFFGPANEQNIPYARLMSRDGFLKWVPGLKSEGITGGALWFDAQVVNTERLVWQFIRSAMEKGALAINHAIAVSHTYDRAGGRHVLSIRDQLTGIEKTLTTATIVDCSGAWNFIKHCLPESPPPGTRFDENITFLKSVNIVIRKKLFDKAVGVNVIAKQAANSRLYFFSPWRDHMIIGTWYSSAELSPSNDFSYHEANDCINEINTAFSQELLHVDDICNIHIGYLPALKNQHTNPSALDKCLLSNYQFKHWADYPAMQNVYSLRGTKYTLARHDARQVIDRLAKTMKWKVTASRSDRLPLYQASSTPVHTYSLTDEIVQQLLINYGAGIEQLFDYIKENPQSVELIPATQYHINAEIYYAVFYEQALTLTDLLKRRLDTGDCGPPEAATAQYCARVMQRLLSWSDASRRAQLAALYASYPEFLVRDKSPELESND